jgi:antitoxin (DNA-binding transcriptional repressor) of toxin-antitoxin stability system
MLSVSIEELAKHSETISSELRAGHSLKLLQGGKRVGEISPQPSELTEEERDAIWRRMIAFMEKGLELGGVPLTRDEMHER